MPNWWEKIKDAGQDVIDVYRGKPLGGSGSGAVEINIEQAGDDYAGLLAAGVAGQAGVMEDLLRWESRFRPRIAEIEMDTLERMFPRQLELYRKIMPAMTQLELQSTRDTRAAELADIERFGPQLQGAVDRLRPRQAEMKRLLDDQAIAGLKAGGQLSPYQKRMTSQGAHEIFSRSGMSGYGPAEGMAELELQHRASMQMEDRNRRFAQQQMQIDASTQLDIPMYLTGRTSRTPINIAPGVFNQTQSLSPGQVMQGESQMLMDLAGARMGMDMYNQGRGSRYKMYYNEGGG